MTRYLTKALPDGRTVRVGPLNLTPEQLAALREFSQAEWAREFRTKLAAVGVAANSTGDGLRATWVRIAGGTPNA